MGAVCLAGASYYLGVLDKVYPVDTWLIWSLAALWGWMLVFSLACVCMGQLILQRLLRLDNLPVLESAVQSMAVGVVAFVMGMYAGGALGLFHPVFAVLLPAGFIAAGGRPTLRFLARARQELALARPASPFAWLVSACGIVCVGLVYLQLMTPDALNYDSTWSHLVIAQDYARNGRIIRFLGNFNMGVPHLASLVHTWGFTVPGLERPALRWMMALHNEFGLFLWTLAGILAGVRRLTELPRLRSAWAAFFLFPIIFVYDSNIGGAADHVAAFFAVPLLLAALDTHRTFAPASAALLAISAAGGLLTKYQVAYLLVPIGLLLGVRWLVLAVRLKLRKVRESDADIGWRELTRTPLMLAGLGALLISPHFVKNLIFYDNPVYPLAMDVFRGSYPSYPAVDTPIRYIFTDDNWMPKGTTLQKLANAAKLSFTFSFEPHYSFTRNVPAMGSLFTLLLPLIIFVKDRGRIVFGTIVVLGAIFIWAYTYTLDRNIQIFMPIMVCVTAALIVRGWQLGWVARAGLVPLVALQIAWGGDAPFYSGQERMNSSLALIRSGFDGTAKKRFDGYRSGFLAVKKALPENARVLLHGSHLSLGIDREIIQDWQGFQGYISYDDIKSVRELYDYFRARGITHILDEPRGRAAPSKQEEIVFQGLLLRHALAEGRFGHFRLFRMLDTPPPVEDPYMVVTFELAGYQDGLYPIQALSTNEALPDYVRRYAPPREPIPPGSAARLDLVNRAQAVLVGKGAGMDPAVSSLLKEHFEVGVRHGFTLYLRKR